MKNFVILLVAGGSTRFKIADKCLLKIKNCPVFAHSLKTFLNIQDTSEVIVVFRDDIQQREIVKYIVNDQYLSQYYSKIHFVKGGSERKYSVFNALNYIHHEFKINETDIVAIHDGARPFITEEKIHQLFALARQNESAVLMHKITDTVCSECVLESDIAVEFYSNVTYIDRNYLMAIETPQVFNFNKIFIGYKSAIEQNLPLTDDSGAFPGKIFFLENTENNRKITFQDDIALYS